jgi:glycosyltransferase involved in cell wall biosynthesis
MSSRPLVSIVVNNFNYERFLREAIDSALAQTYAPVEVIVIDDGSTDGSREIIASYGDRVVPILKPNGGQGSTFNAGFAASRGEIVCFLDADDRFLPDKARRVVEVFEQHPQAGWCFHALRLIDTRTGAPLPPSPREPTRFIDFRNRIKRAKMPTFARATSGISYRRDLLACMLPMPELEGTSADRFVKMVGLGLAPGVYLDEELAEQKIHGDNAYTRRPEKQRVGAKSHVFCAHWMRERFPEMSRFANKLFAIGLGMYWRSGGVDAKYADVVDAYMSRASLGERIGIRGRAFYHSQPWLRRVRQVVKPVRADVAAVGAEPVPASATGG